MEKIMRKSFIWKAILLLLVFCWGAQAFAAAPAPTKLMGRTTGHYEPDLNALEGAVNPAAGSDILAITLSAYHAGTQRDSKGGKTPSPDVYALGNSWSWIHMFENGLFNGSTGFKLTGTWGNVSIRGDMLPENQQVTRIGDPSFEFTQGWKFDKVAFIVRLGVAAGIGDYSKESMVNYAKGFWSFYAQSGATCWFDEDRRFSATLLGTYETNSYMQQWSVRPGDAFTLEAGSAYWLNQHLALGVSGNAVWQVTPDSGKDVGWDRSSNYRSYSAGPYARIMLPFIKPWGQLTIGWWHEFGGRNHLEGDRVVAQLCFPF
jgi:hypothetical protein